jgi:dihydrofolate reductase
MPHLSGHHLDNRPPLAIIVAMTRRGVIGRGGTLPWDLPEDRRLFRRLTEGNTVLMGRLTFESLTCPLPHRHNIVISRSPRHYAGATVCPNLREGVDLGWRLGRPLFVIGGGELYRQALPLADTLHVSWIEGDFPGDRFFPDFELAGWEMVESVDYPGFAYVMYRRVNPAT